MNMWFALAMMEEFNRVYGLRMRSNNELYKDFCKAYTRGVV